VLAYPNYLKLNTVLTYPNYLKLNTVLTYPKYLKLNTVLTYPKYLKLNIMLMYFMDDEGRPVITVILINVQNAVLTHKGHCNSSSCIPRNDALSIYVLQTKEELPLVTSLLRMHRR